MEIYQINTTQDGNIIHAARARGVSLQKSCTLRKKYSFSKLPKMSFTYLK
jgi:hypothetical protein